jgi:predicted Zn-dependent protease
MMPSLRHRFRLLIGLGLSLGSLLVVAACATSPTGRSQVLMLPEAEMDAMGVAAFDEIANATPHSTNTAQVDYVTCVANAITRALPSTARPYDWEVIVFEDPSPNAFALPGGKIGVHTGLLTVAEDQDQLAAVVAHEVAHVLAHHGNERMSQQQIAGLGMSIAEAVVLPESPYRTELLGALGLGVQYGALMPYSRSHESEADIYGLELASAAGFDPRASVVLWQNMAAASKGPRPVEFLSTHPNPRTRIADLKRKIPQVMPAYEAAVAAGRRPRCR